MKSGRCVRDKCNNPISTLSEGNSERLCDMHYEKKRKLADKRSKRKIYKSEAQKKSEREVRKILKLILMDPSDYKMMMTRKDWVAPSRIRKSKFIDVIRSRPWKNTEALLSRVNIAPETVPWSECSRNIFLLYLRGFFHSREYTKPNNSYNRWLVISLEENESIAEIKNEDVITMNLEVSKILLPQDKANFSSSDVLLAPSKLRRMVAGEKRKAYKELEETNKTLSRPLSMKPKKKKIKGLYSTIRKYEGVASAEKLLMDLHEELKSICLPYNCKPLATHRIEKILPISTLCKEEFIRIYSIQKSDILFMFEKALSLYPMMKEIAALILLHRLLSGASAASYSHLNKLNKISRNEQSLIKNLLRAIKLTAKLKLGLDITDNGEVVKFYNSFFSSNVIELDDKTLEIKSIIKFPKVGD